jgi:hypothetical protein
VLIRHGAKWDGDPKRLLEEAAARKAEAATADEPLEDESAPEDAEEAGDGE